MLTDDNRIRRYGLSPCVIALRGNQSTCNHFSFQLKVVKPDHLDFDPEPCRAGLPQVPTGADPTRSTCGGLIDPVSLWGFSHQQELGWKVLLLWLQGIWAGGTTESEYKPQLPGILDRGICAFLCLNFFIYDWRAGGDREGWHSPDALTKCTGADAQTCAATAAPPRLFTCCLLPCAQDLSFRNKIAVHSIFHNALRESHKLFAVIYQLTPLGAARKEASEETCHTTLWVRTHSTLIIIYLTLKKNPIVKQNITEKKIKNKICHPMEQPFVDLTAKASSQETGAWDLSKQKRFGQKNWNLSSVSN